MSQAVAKNRDLTIGQVASVAGVAPKTAAKWVDAGKLKGYRVPLGKDRRVRAADLKAFLVDNGMRDRTALIPLGFRTRPVVLFVGFAEGTVFSSASWNDVDREFAPAGFAGGVAMAEIRPDVVVVDSAIGRIEATQAATAAKAMSAVAVVVGGWIAGFDSSADSLAEIAGVIQELLSEGR